MIVAGVGVIVPLFAILIFLLVKGLPALHLSLFTENPGPTGKAGADTSGGQVNFSPALQPGQTTYFSLEEPPTSTTIGVGSSPSGLVSSPPQVGTSKASAPSLTSRSVTRA